MYKNSITEEDFINNQKLSQIEIREKRLVLESKPSILTAIITNRCNLKCIMCSRVRIREDTLPFDLLKKVYALLPYLKWIDWQGGEVFLVDYFKELFLHVAQYPHIEQHIATNGVLITEDWARIFAQSKVNLIYSIDGVTKDTYEFIRTGARFEDLLKSLDLVNEYKNKFDSQNRLELSVVVMKCNYKSLPLFVDFCRKYNFKHLNLNLLLPDIAPEQDIIFCSDPGPLDYLRQVVPEIKKSCREQNIEVDCFFESFLQKNQQNNLTEKKRISTFSCVHPWTRIHIEWDGKVKPACQCNLGIGRLDNNLLDDIWNGSEMQRYRRLLSDNCADQICTRQCLDYIRGTETDEAGG